MIGHPSTACHVGFMTPGLTLQWLHVACGKKLQQTCYATAMYLDVLMSSDFMDFLIY